MSGITTAVGKEIVLERRQGEIRRILGSAAFAKAPRLCALLAHIAEHTLSGELDDLTEQQIGIQVFGRTPGYNSAEDTIVRGTARHLRQRLEAYYAEEGRSDEIRISIPKGSYVARFEEAIHESEFAKPSAADVLPKVLPAPPSVSGGEWPFAAKITVAALALALGICAFFLARQKQVVSRSDSRLGPQALWQALFAPGRKTLLVPGDASLDAYVAWEQRPVSLADYTNQKYQTEITISAPPNERDVPIGVRSATPMADLKLISELVHVPRWMGQPEEEPWIEIRYARDVVVGDTHDSNLILIGTPTFNPWVTLYRSGLDFHADWDYKNDVYLVTNSAPKPGELPEYKYERKANTTWIHPITHIAYTDNSQGQGKVLIVEGTSMGSTYAAVAFLTREYLWKPVIAAATDKDGHLHNFEVLLSSDFVRGGTSNSRVIATHIHQCC